MLGVEAVLPTGEIIRSGGRLVKDVAGYDLRRLLCGSEGTLAVMTELTLRLVPAPESSGTGMAYFPDLADAARAVSRVLASGVLPVTLEFLDQVCIGAVEDYAAHRPRHVGRRAADLRPGRRPGRDRPRHAAHGEACGAEGATWCGSPSRRRRPREVLEARRAALPSLSRLEPLTILEDATVPRSRIAEMVEYIQEVARAPRAQDRHVRPRGRRQPASDRGPGPRGRGRGPTVPTPPSTRSSPGRSSWTAPSPASTGSAS